MARITFRYMIVMFALAVACILGLSAIDVHAQTVGTYTETNGAVKNQVASVIITEVSTQWSYTSGTSPILSNTTTAVTIKAAAATGVRNYVDSCQIGSTALGASVPFAIRDGAGGTVLWADRPPTAGWLTPVVINFLPPLKGTAATLLEVVTTTADTSGTFDVNCQGHTATP